MGWASRLCALALWSWASLALAVVELDADTVSRQVTSELSYLRDDSRQLPLAQVLAAPAGAWQPSDDHTFNKGFSSAAWWLRFDMRHSGPRHERQLLEIAYAVLDHVEVWVLEDGRVRAYYRLGDKQPFAQRLIEHRYFLVPLQPEPDKVYTVLLRVRTTSSVQVPLALWQESAYVRQEQLSLLGHGVYFGCMLVLVFYNLFIFLRIGDRNYLYYVLYVLFMPLFVATQHGLAFQYLWPEATTWNAQAVLVTISGTVLSVSLFTDRFLQLSVHLPRLSLLLRSVATLAGLLLVGALFLPYTVVIRPVIVVTVLACLACLTAGALRWRQSDTMARFYTIAWAPMLAGSMMLALNKFQILPQNFFTQSAAQIGSALEGILLSFVLAERINIERRLRSQAQEEALASERMSRQAQAEALEVQRHANETLEQRVQERTLALEEANRQLADLSATDQLTGLKNRRYLDSVLSEEFARCQRYGHSIAVLLLDIDHFKRFNDTYGHLVGDACLRTVAGALHAAVRWPMDKVARYGGEEFCMVLPETDADGAVVVAERIRYAVEALVFEVAGARVPVTVSVGVAAVIPAAAETYELLVAEADRALYRAKSAGRNCVVVGGALTGRAVEPQTEAD